MESISGSFVQEIVAHEWKMGLLQFKVKWKDDSTSWELLRDTKEDYHKITAQYIVVNLVS